MGFLSWKTNRKSLYVKTSTKNDFIYGELGRTTYYTRRNYIIIRYWLKVIHAEVHILGQKRNAPYNN